MPRKGPVSKPEVLPDPKYHNKMVTKFINKVMMSGKRSLAEQIFYGSMEQLQKKGGKDAIVLFQQAMDNTMPMVEVRPRRVGGATYQVPVEVRQDRRVSLAMRWLIGAARKRSGKTMMEKLAAELLDASQGVGTAVKKREDTHRMAEANKAFAHYRW